MTDKRGPSRPVWLYTRLTNKSGFFSCPSWRARSSTGRCGLWGSYTGNKNVDFTAGVKNLFDQKPPYSNQSTTFQQGFDPRYTGPLGATVFMRLTYKF